MDIVVATRNSHKLQEIRQILGGLPITLHSAADLGAPEVVEDRDTLEDNALKKAREVALATGKTALADDTGLLVDALEGRPGVYSARYAGDGATYADNVKKLLGELEGVPAGARRAARFECVIALATPVAREAAFRGRQVAFSTFSGTLEGEIALGARGSGGFGYDPVFLVKDDPEGRTLAELSADQKNAVSHRAVALQLLRAHLAAAGVV